MRGCIIESRQYECSFNMEIQNAVTGVQLNFSTEPFAQRETSLYLSFDSNQACTEEGQ